MRKNSKVKTEWNLGLLYKNEKDPQIEKDLRMVEKLSEDFARKYRNKNFTASSKKLLQALKDHDRLLEKTNIKPWWYFALRTDLNSDDALAGAKATQYEQRLTQAQNKLTFFDLKIGKTPKVKQKEYLKYPPLAPYKYSLKKVFELAKYRLTEKEEQLEDLLSQTSYTMWVDGGEKVLTQKTIKHEGKEMPVGAALKAMDSLPPSSRRKLLKSFNNILKTLSPLAESEINAIVNYKKIMDELKGFAHPYSETVISHEMSEKNVENIVRMVEKYFKISHRFYKLHAKLLKEKRLTVADRSVNIGKIKRRFSFEESLKIVKEAFDKVDTRYGDMVMKFAENGQFDVYPRKGKKNGAYSWGGKDAPSFVLLNHIDTIDSVETLAHEMGHSIHTELSKSQPYRYQGYSTAVAEVASTFFEQLTSEHLETYLSEKERIVLLHNKLMGDMSTIFRQVACFNFEVEMHNTIREQGQVPASALAKLMTKHLHSYFGPAVDVTEDDGYIFVYWSHIRRFFYVYSYAFGQLTSRALFEAWKKDNKFSTQIRKFLSSGRSMSPAEIFQSIGIDTSKTAFFEAGLKGIERDIERLEKLTKTK